MRKRTPFALETLEVRTLLVHIGIDLGFGDAGRAPVTGSVLLADVSGGKVLAVDGTGATRLNADGTRDDSFDDAGDAPVTERIVHQAVVSGSRLILIGELIGVGRQPLFLRAIHLDDGSADASFGDGDGDVDFSPPPAEPGAVLKDLALVSAVATADGGVVLSVVQFLAEGGEQFEGNVLYKFDASGQLDDDFGDAGQLVLENDERIATYPTLAPHPNGKFLVVETTESSPTLSRYNEDGTLDTSFAGTGVLSLPTVLPAFFPFYGEPLVQPDGGILIPYEEDTDSGAIGFLGRLTATGAVDASFGDDGSIRFGSNRIVRRVALDGENRIVGSTSDGQIFRLSADGEFDLTFDDDGRLFLREATPQGVIEPAALGPLDVDASGRVLLGRASGATRLTARDRVEIAPGGRVQIVGSDGADTLTASRSGDRVVVTLNGEAFRFDLGDVTGFEVDGATGGLTANLAVNVPVTLLGTDGDDSIRTAGGTDRIVSGAGEDTVDAGAGRDTIFGGHGDDSLAGGTDRDKVFGQADADAISGGDGDDWLFGGSPFPGDVDDSTDRDRDDTISGGGGRDRLFGDWGNDVLGGNAGGDLLDGGSGADRLAGHGGSDQLRGAGGHDRLYGGRGTDFLFGGTGDDHLFGKGLLFERDRLTGSAGRDTADADDDDLLDGVEFLLE